MKPQENHEWFLGSVEFDVIKKQFTRLRPVARSAANSVSWEQNDRELREAFPTQGLACWFNAPLGLHKHQIVEFQAAAIPGFDGTSKPDKFQVIQPHYPIIEVIEPPLNDEDSLRQALKAEGLALKRPPIGRVIFRVSETCWLGPFDLIPREDGRWALPAEVKFDAVPSFDAPPVPLSEVRIDGTKRTILLTRGCPVTARQFLNWQSDAEVLRSMLKRLHKLDPAAFKSVGLAYAALDAYIVAASNASLLPDQQIRERALVERVKRLRHDLPVAMQLVDEIVDMLALFGTVKQRIEARMAELGKERKAEIDERIAAETQLLEHLQRQTAAARQEHDALAKQVAAKRKAAERDFVATDAAMQEKLNQLREAPARAVADLLASSSVFAALLPGSITEKAPRSRLRVAPAEGVVLQNAQSTIDALTARLMSEGIDPSSALPLLAAFASGMVPIVGGDAAEEALRVVGQCLCAGHSWSVTVSPATVSLADLLMPSAGALTGLREIIDAAYAHPDELLLAVIEGIDLGASEGYLLPLLALPLGDLLPAAGEGEARSWPENLLLAATVSRARLAQPLPRRTWERVPLFLFSWLASIPSLAQTALPLARVAMSNWRTFRQSNGALAPSAHRFSATPPAHRLADRLYSAIVALQPSAEAETPIRTHVLAPACASAASDLPLEFPPSARAHFDCAKALISENYDNS